jgi:diguanylate cyclase (GGDEF)-like protein/PAS domain S-box-containing protein
MSLTGTKDPKAQEYALTQQLLASVFMAVGAAVAIIATDGRFIAVNPAFAALVKRSGRSLEGRRVWDLVTGAETRLAASWSAGSEPKNSAFELDSELIRGDGSTAPVHITLTAIDQPQLRRFLIVAMREAAGASGDHLKASDAKRPVVVVGGKIQLIGLNDVKAALGDSWPAHAERAMMLAESILRKRLAPQDHFSRTADHGFVISFAHGTETEAPARAAIIAREIRNRLIGDADDPAGSAVTAVTRSFTLEPDELEGGRPNLSALEQRLDAGRAEAEQRARAELSIAMATATLEPEQLFDPKGQAVPIVIAALPNDLEEQIDIALATLPSSDSVDADVDVLLLTLVAETALVDIGGGRNIVYLLPVDFSVFSARKRQERYLEICRKLPDAVRQRVMLLLSGVSRSVGQGRLFHVFRLLKPFAKGVGIDLESIEIFPTDLTQYRIPLASISAEKLLEAARSSVPRLNRLIRQIQLNNARLVARRVHGESERSAIVRLGADLVSFVPGSGGIEQASDPTAIGRTQPAAYAVALETAPSGIFVTDPKKPDNPIVFCNPAATRITGYPADELVGRNCRMLQGAGTDRQVVAELREAIGRGAPIRREILNYRRDGTPFWNELVISPVHDATGDLVAFVSFQTDITEFRRAEAGRREMFKLYEELAENVPGFFFQRVMGADGEIKFTYLSPSFRRLVGAPAEEPADTFLTRWVHPEDSEALKQKIRQSAADLSPASVEYRLIGTDGQFRWVRAKSRPQRSANGNIVWNGVAIDVTPEKEAEGRVSYLSGYDVLTGLLSGNAFRNRLCERLRHAHEAGGRLAVLSIDLAAFQTVNDAFGRMVGDTVLKAVGQRIAAFELADLVGRDGGDDFLVALSGAGDSLDAAAPARRLIREIAKPIDVDGRTLSIPSYAGLALYPDHIADPGGAVDRIAEDLIKNADVALYTSKRAGPGTCHVYSAEADDRIRNRAILQQSIHEAFEKQQLSLHFQPVVELASGRILGAEALIRWYHPQLGVQRPDQFIPIAEQSGLIVPIGEWVLEQALRHLGDWKAISALRPRVAVNVAPAQLQHPDALRILRERIVASGVDPTMIEIELTESAFIDPTPPMLASLEALRELGVTIAMDDFGTGYSSFRYLRSLPIDKLKIDQSFVRKLVPESSDHAIVKGMIRIGQDLNLKVVVEGVETAEQRDILVREGCGIGQGYFFSMPVTVEDFSWMLNERATLPLTKAGAIEPIAPADVAVA